MDNENKIIQYPNLKHKLLEKGTELLQEKQYHEALTCFQQLIDLGEEEPEAFIGSVICFMEIGELEKAKQRCKEILFSDQGDYFEVLNIYLSILIQLEEYDEVVKMVEAILSENQAPHHQIESLEQLLTFSKKMLSEKHVGREQQDHDFVQKEVNRLLEEKSSEKQWLIIQQLNKIDHPKIINVFKDYVEDGNQDPVLVSIVLQMLHAKGCEDTVNVTKFGREIEVNLQDLQDVFQMPIAHEVVAALKRVIEQNNPILYEQATQVWWNYLLVIYPFVPNESDAKIWAAALHATVNEMNGLEDELTNLEHDYEVNIDLIIEYRDKILDMEKYAIKGMKY
jgi:tetratricopeptide (TPR) repeat protein